MVKRTFIAQTITVSSVLQEKAAILKRELQGITVKWTELSNMHLTLAFLGDTAPDQLNLISGELNKITSNYCSFTITLNGLGAFRSVSNPQVLWVGVEAEHVLGLLYRDIQKMIGNFGFATDDRTFKPHLTLGRVKSFSHSNNLKELYQEHSKELKYTFTADTIVYYESTLTPAGPVYNPISTHKLG